MFIIFFPIHSFKVMILNGLTIRRNRARRTIEIHSIENNILSSRIPNYTCEVGDTVIELNGQNITSMTLPEVNGILRTQVLYMINTIGHVAVPPTNQITYDNGLEIRRSRNNRGAVEIHSINNNILRDLIPNYSCQIGDALIAINNINIVGMTFTHVVTLLRTQLLRSISTQRSVSSTQENLLRANNIHPDVPVQNRSYNQLLEGN